MSRTAALTTAARALWVAVSSWGVLLVLLSSSSGCADDPSTASAARCTSSADCANLELCQRGRCIGFDDGTAPGSFALRIQPPSFRPDLVQRQVRNVPVAPDGSLPAFILNRPVRVIGSLSYVQDATPLIADLRWRNTDGVPGQEFAVNTTSAAQSGAFSLELPAGFYDVTIVPEFATMPRYDVRNVLMNDDGTSACAGDPTAFCQAWSYALIPPSEHLAIRGRVTRRRGSATVPAVGVTVFAQNTDASVESAESLTDDNGDFIVFLPPRDDAWSFSVRASDEWARGTTVKFEPVTILRDSPPETLLLSLDALGDTVPLRVLPEPSVATDSSPVWVTRGQALYDPQAAARANPGIASALVRQQYSAEELEPDGSLLIRLLPGEYDLSMILTEAPARLATPVTIEVQPDPIEDLPSTRTITLPLDPLVELTLEVSQTPTAAATESLTVEVTPLRLGDRDVSELGPAQAVFSRTLTAPSPLQTTLPAGDYRVDIRTPSGSGSTRTSYLLTVPTTGLRASLVLPEFTAIQGRLLGPDGTPLAGAVVDAWDMRTLNQRADPTASATTDADGRYDLVVPSQSWNDAAHGSE